MTSVILKSKIPYDDENQLNDIIFPSNIVNMGIPDYLDSESPYKDYLSLNQNNNNKIF